MKNWMNWRAVSVVLQTLVLLTLMNSCSEGTDNRTPAESQSYGAALDRQVSDQSLLSNPRLSPNEASPKTVSSERLAKLKEDFAQSPFKVLQIAELSYQNSPAIAVTLSVPVDPNANWRNYLQVLSDQGAPFSGDWILGEQLNVVYFPFVEPNTVYHVRVTSGLRSLTGRLLAQQDEKSVRTKPRQQSVKFVSRGSQLAPKLSEGLTVEAVNVKAVDVDFLRVHDDAIGKLLASGFGNHAYALKQLKQSSTLVYSARFDLNSRENTTEKTVLPLAQIKELQEPGVYFTVMKEAGDYPYNYHTTWFSVGDIGVQTRQYPNQLVAMVHSAINVAPLSAVKVVLYGRDGRELASQNTDEQGLATFTSSMDQAAYLIASHTGKDSKVHSSVLSLTGAAMDLSEFSLASRQNFPLEFFMYGPRDLYRPGETLHVNGLLRDHDGKRLNATRIKVRILRPDGRVFKSFTWQGDDQAFYEYQTELPQQTLTGEWNLKAKLGNGREFTYPFKVEEFLPERMKLRLAANPDEVVEQGQSLTIDVQGDYLYGAPAAGNRVEATLVVRPKRTLFDAWKGFVFGAEDYNAHSIDLGLADVHLDDEGAAQIHVPSEWSGATQPLNISTRVSLFESGGRPVSRTMNHTYWPTDTLVGVRPLWEGKVAAPRQDVSLEIINVDTSGNLLPKDTVTLTMYRENARYYWMWDNGWQSQRSEGNTPVYSRVISIASEERTRIDLPVEYGHYRVELRDQQQALLNSYRFYAGWRWDRPEPGSTGRPDKLDLTLNADVIASGEQATLTFNAPYDGLAMLTIESDELVWLQNHTVTAGENTLTLLANQDWGRHDLYATVTLLRSGDSERKYLPKRAFGLVHLPLNRDERKVNVTLSAPESVLPGASFSTKIQIDNIEGEAFATLAAVDTGVLSLTGFETPNAFDWFFARRGYSPDIRDTWAAFIEQLSAKVASQRFGGDAEEMARGGDAPQSDVQIVSLYSGKVALNAQGEGEVTFDLPYFNGELRLMAMVWSGNRFGQQESKVNVAAPLIAEMSTPRFLAKGDTTQATLDLQNLTDRNLNLSVTLTASKLIGGESLTESLQLTPQQKTVLQLPLKGKAYSGTGSIVLTVVENQSDPTGDTKRTPASVTRSWNLGLRPAFPAETVKVENVVKSGEQHVFSLEHAKRYDADTLGVRLSVSPNPPLDVQEQLQRLIQYPYGCLEQTTSRAWPLLQTGYDDLLKYDVSEDKRIAKHREEWVNKAIARISGMQRSDGSFGLWSNQSPEAHWLTVYATEFLIAAKEQGFSVDDGVLNTAISKVKSYVTVRSIQWSERQHYSQWPQHYHFSYRAYAAYVMAKRQQVSLGDVRHLFDRYHQNGKTPLPFAQLARALELLGDATRSKKAWALALSHKEPERGYGGDYASKVRDQAWITSLALQSQLVDEPLQLIFTLRDNLVSRRWMSTQERFALYTLGKQLSDREVNWSAELVFNGSATVLDQRNPWRGYWRQEAAPAELALENTTSSPLYSNLSFQGFPVVPQYNVADGIGVQRTFYNDKGEPISLANVQTGDLILVRVDLASLDEYRLPDAMLVELLPSGLELENQNLETSVKMNDMRVDGKTVTQWMSNTTLVHQEYRDDRYVAALSLTRQLSTVFYLARAVTPGEYLVPPSFVEDMYRPEIRAVGKEESALKVKAK